MAMKEADDENSEEELEVIHIDEVTSGWGESHEEEEAKQQAEALLPVPLPRPVAPPRPAMTSFAQIARGAASPFSLPQQPPFSFTPATPPPTFALSPAAGTVAALSLTDAAVAPAAKAELTPVRDAVAAPLPPLMMKKKRAAAEAVATAMMPTVAAAAVSSEAEAVMAIAASVVVAVAEEARDDDTDVGEGSEEEAAMEFASPEPSPLRKKPSSRPPNGTNGQPMRWHGPKEAGHWVVAKEQPATEEGMAEVFSASPRPPPPLPLPPPPPPPQPQPQPPPPQPQEPSQLLLSLGPLKVVGRTLQRECCLVPAASAVGAVETAAAEVPAARVKKVQITAAASAAALRVEAAEVEVMEVEVEVIDEAEAAVVPAAQVRSTCEYCNSRGKVHRRCVRLPSCHIVWQRGGKRKHDASRKVEAAEAARAVEAAKTPETETAKAATVVAKETEGLCASTESSASYKKNLLRRWVAEEPASGAAATVEPAEVRQTDVAEAALRQAEVEGLTLQRSGNKSGFRGVHTKTRSSRFQAIVWHHTRGGSKNLGTFTTAEEAALAYARTSEAQAEVAGADVAAPATKASLVAAPAKEASLVAAPATKASLVAAPVVAAAAVQVQAAASQCERNPRCTRGFYHFGKGGKCSLCPLPAAGDAFLEETAEGELEQDDGGGCFCGADHLQSVGITFNGMSHWATFNDSWIQCDDCDRWCHSQCAGFDKQSAEKAEVYSCPTCLYAARTKRVLAGDALMGMEGETTAAAPPPPPALQVVAMAVKEEAPAAIEVTETADVVSWRFTKLEMDTIPEEEDEDGVDHENEDGVEDEDEDEDEADDKVEAEAAEMQQDVEAEGATDVEMDVVEMMCTSPDQWGMLYAPLSGLFRSNSHSPLATSEPVPPYTHPDPQ